MVAVVMVAITLKLGGGCDVCVWWWRSRWHSVVVIVVVVVVVKILWVVAVMLWSHALDGRQWRLCCLSPDRRKSAAAAPGSCFRPSLSPRLRGMGRRYPSSHHHHRHHEQNSIIATVTLPTIPDITSIPSLLCYHSSSSHHQHPHHHHHLSTGNRLSTLRRGDQTDHGRPQSCSRREPLSDCVVW